jgi:uncharacterized protein YjdB/uncharacterized protein YuzE
MKNLVSGNTEAFIFQISTDGTVTPPSMKYVKPSKAEVIKPNLLNSIKTAFGGTFNDVYNGVVQTKDGGYVAVGSSNSVDGDLLNTSENQKSVFVKYDKDGNITFRKTFQDGAGGTAYYWGDFRYYFNHSFTSVKQNSDGTYYVAGSRNRMGYAPSATAELYKLDKDGNVIWIANSNIDSFNSMDTFSDGSVIVTGYNGVDNKIVKYDVNGNLVFEKSFSGTGVDILNSVKTLVDGSFVVGGETDSVNGSARGLSSQGMSDAIIVKYDSNGEIIWKKNYGGTKSDRFKNIVKIKDGGFLAIGTSLSKDGDLSELVSDLSKESEDGIIVKYDENGNIQWNTVVSGSGVEKLNAGIEVANGGFIIVGSSNSNDQDFLGINKGDYDGILIKLASDGGFEWKSNFGGSSVDEINDVSIVQNTNSLVIVGSTSSTDGVMKNLVSGNTEAFIFQINPITLSGVFEGEYTKNSITPTWDNGTALLSKNGGTFKTLINGSKIDEEGTFVLKINDSFGDVLKINFQIDKTPPVINGINNYDLTNQSVTLKWNKGTAQYSLNSGSFNSLTSSTVLTNSGIYQVKVIDSLGLETIVNFTIDKTPPLITGISEGDIVNHSVNPAWSDGKAYFKINNGAFNLMAQDTILSAEGNYTVKATDDAGNSNQVSFTIDKTIPTLSGISDGDVVNRSVSPTWNEGSAFSKKNNGVFTKMADKSVISGNGNYEIKVVDVAGNEVKIKFTIDMDVPVISGVNSGKLTNQSVVIKWDEGNAKVSRNGNPFSSLAENTTLTADGVYVVKVMDAAGNESQTTFTIDKSAPIISGINDGDVVNTNVIPKWSDGSALISKNSGAFTVLTAGTVLSTNGYYTVKVKDAAGNESVVKFTIDTVAPTISGISGGIVTNLTVNPGWSDGTAYLSQNNNAFITIAPGYKITDDGLYILKVKDKAGNSTQIIFTIDKTPPELAGIPESGLTKENVTISWEDGTGLIARGDGDFTPIQSNTTVSGDGEYVVKIQDDAGNTTEKKFTIDQTVPEIYGVSDGGVYNKPILVTWDTASVKMKVKNGPFQNFANDSYYLKDDGSYSLVVTDKAGNINAVNFTFAKSGTPLIPVTSIAIDQNVVALEKGDTEQLVANVFPSNATDKNVIWISSDSDIASVSDKGIVTGVSDGMTTISAFSTQSGYQASVYVVVKNKVATTFMINQMATDLVKGQKTSLSASDPNYPTLSNADISWISSDSKVASVNEDGVVTALRKGTVVITAQNKATGISTEVSINVLGVEMRAQDAFEVVNPAVAKIEAYDADNKLVSSGSGFAISADGKLITNLHVVFNPNQPIVSLKVIFPDQTYENVNSVLGFDMLNDVAILQIENVSDLPYVEMGDISEIRTGDRALAIGSPQGLGNTLTQGIISAKIRNIAGINYIQTDTGISNGSSGGVLLNEKGEVIGITTAGFGVVGANLNLAVPITVLNQIDTTTPKKLTDISDVYISEEGGIKRYSLIKIKVSGISINEKQVTLKQGSTKTVKAIVTPTNASLQQVKWTSSNTKVATVTNGVIKALTKGAATIKATTVDGNFVAQIQVTVGVPVTGIRLDKETLDLKVKNSTTLKATVTPTDASNKKVVWTSSNSKIATVDSNGIVTAISNGTAVITASTLDNDVKASATVNVFTPVSSVSLNKTTLTLTVKKSATLIAKLNPSTASNQEIIWSTSNSSVAKVDKDGKVTAIATGTAVITATSVDGNKKDTVKITVKK